MNLDEINDKLTVNYLDKVREYFTDLKKHGHIIINENGILHHAKYDAWGSEFIKLEKLDNTEVIDVKAIENPLNAHKTNEDLINILMDVLPCLDSTDINAYFRYEKNNKNALSDKELKEDLKKHLSVNSKLGGDIDKTLYLNAKTQGEALAHLNVFFSGRNGDKLTEMNKFYIYDNKAFRELETKEMHQLLLDFFGVTSNEIKRADVEKRARNIYRECVMETDFPIIYNEQIKTHKALKKDKKAHDDVYKTVFKNIAWINMRIGLYKIIRKYTNMTDKKRYARTTIEIEENNLEQVKRLALDRKTTQKEIINEYIEKGLEKEDGLKQSKLTE